VLGCLLDHDDLLLVLVPLLLPIARALGVDLVHFGSSSSSTLDDRPAHPALRMLLFVLSGLAGTPVKEIRARAVPFILVLIAVLFLSHFVQTSVIVAFKSSTG